MGSPRGVRPSARRQPGKGENSNDQAYPHHRHRDRRPVNRRGRYHQSPEHPWCHPLVSPLLLERCQVKEKTRMTKRILTIAIATAALLIGVAATTNRPNTHGVTPWCPPFCSNVAK